MQIKTIIASLLFSITTMLCFSEIGVLVQKKNTATYIETLSGLKKYLKEKKIDKLLVIKNANNDKNMMRQISEEYANDKNIKLVIVLGSSAVKVANEVIKNKPVVFGGVNHPRGLGINGKNITGVSYYINPRSMIYGLLQIIPEAKTIGILYEPPEQNGASIVEVPEIEKACQAQKLESVKEYVKNKNDISKKTKALIDKGAQVIILPTNSLLYNNVNEIRTIADEKKIPIVSFSKVGISNGALFGLTVDNTKLGIKLGTIVYKIFKEDIKPEDIPYDFSDKYLFIVNETTAQKIGIKIPKKIISRAIMIK